MVGGDVNLFGFAAKLAKAVEKGAGTVGLRLLPLLPLYALPERLLQEAHLLDVLVGPTALVVVVPIHPNILLAAVVVVGSKNC